MSNIILIFSISSPATYAQFEWQALKAGHNSPCIQHQYSIAGSGNMRKLKLFVYLRGAISFQSKQCTKNIQSFHLARPEIMQCSRSFIPRRNLLFPSTRTTNHVLELKEKNRVPLSVMCWQAFQRSRHEGKGHWRSRWKSRGMDAPLPATLGLVTAFCWDMNREKNVNEREFLLAAMVGNIPRMEVICHMIISSS